MSARSERVSLTSEPVVGICAVRERARWSFWDQPADLVANSYVASVQRTGAIAILLPVDTRAPLELLERIDALLLIGGSDVDPALYGAQPEAGLEATYPERDEFEIALLRGALERELPVLGICRGLHLINVGLGGTLHQDVVDEHGHHPHRKAHGSFEGTEHRVALTPGSLVAEAAGEEIHVVRCHHHQAVAEIGDGLVVTGRSADDVIEALEAADGRWLLGVQWHPEADERSRLFAALHDAASRYALVD
jgi:putative glutamine amidotransferase